MNNINLFITYIFFHLMVAKTPYVKKLVNSDNVINVLGIVLMISIILEN